MSMTFRLAGKSNAVTFIVAYAPTDTPQSREERDMFWTELSSIVHRVPLKHHLFILMDANVRMLIM